MPETGEHIEIDSVTLEQGYQNCHLAGKKFFRNFLWAIGNLSKSQRRGLDPVLHHAVRTAELLNLDSENGLPVEVWQEIRDNLSDAFLDKYTSLEFAALVDTARQHKIPKQFLFDPIFGADLWIRARGFKTFDELSNFASRVGGSWLAAAIPVLGFVKPNFEAAAIECGKSFLLTQLLANCVNDIKLNKTFIATDDLEDCEVVIHRLKLRHGGTPLKHLVRLYCWRIEKSLTAGGKLIPYLDFDARRSMTSLLALHWKMLTRMQLEPDSLLNEDGVLSNREMFKLRTRHFLGLEGDAALIEDEHH